MFINSLFYIEFLGFFYRQFVRSNTEHTTSTSDDQTLRKDQSTKPRSSGEIHTNIVTLRQRHRERIQGVPENASGTTNRP